MFTGISITVIAAKNITQETLIGTVAMIDFEFTF
jgi:hypothetical protein